MESAESISQVKGVKKMVGFSNYYRVRVGHYRVGLELIDDITVRLIVVLHRKDIYRKFP
jgi:mRNA interferase RelE/StbE